MAVGSEGCYWACRNYEAFDGMPQTSVFEFKNLHFTAWQLRRRPLILCPRLSQSHSIKPQPNLAHLLKTNEIQKTPTSSIFVFILIEIFSVKVGLSPFLFWKIALK